MSNAESYLIIYNDGDHMIFSGRDRIDRVPGPRLRHERDLLLSRLPNIISDKYVA